MQHFIEEIEAYTNEVKSYASFYEWNEVEEQFENWKNEQNKHVVENYYSNPLFGAYYADKLFSARVSSFDQVLQILGQDSNVRRIFETSNSIVSFGCGPGPDIVAYVAYVREELQLPYLQLNILAVDKFRYWVNYVQRLNYCDSNANITFQQGTLNANFLKRMRSHDICLMSYPHSINFESGVWYELQQKFNLIIVLDQAKRALHQRVRSAGYQIEPFYFKGNKWFFYYIHEDIAISDEYDRYSDDSDENSDTDFNEWDDGFSYCSFQDNYPVREITPYYPVSIQSKISENPKPNISTSLSTTTVNQVPLKSILKNTNSQVLTKNSMSNISNTIQSLKKPESQIQLSSPFGLQQPNTCSNGIQNLLFESFPSCSSSIRITNNVIENPKPNISTSLSTTTVDPIPFKSISRNTTSQVLASTSMSNISNTIQSLRKSQSQIQKSSSFGLPLSKNLCSNGIHSLPLGSFHSCSSSIRIKLLCNHECERSCYSVKLLSKQSQTDYNIFAFEHLIECNEICNSQMKCGHFCKNFCKNCSSPRFHGPCREQCQKYLACRNKCGDTCHIGECRQCYKNCLLCRFINLFKIRVKLSKSEKYQWNSIRDILNSKMPKDIQNHVNFVLNKICSDSFSHSIFGKQSFSSDGFQRLIQFYNEMLTAKLVTTPKNRIFLEFLARECEKRIILFDLASKSYKEFLNMDLFKFQIIYSKIKCENYGDVSKLISSIN